jgi:hypothetical protein
MEQVTPKQMFDFYKARMLEVLSKNNPSGLKTVDSLLKQFPGKEHQVYKQICKMCKVEPLPPATAAEILGSFESAPPQPMNANTEGGEVSNWLRSHGFDSYSKLQKFQTMSMKDFFAIKTKGKLIEIGVLPKHSEVLLTEIVKESNQPLPAKADFEVGENCFTKMMLVNSKGEEKWLTARVTHVNDDCTYDIFVHNAANYGVPPDAVNVPRNMLKKSTEDVEIAIPDPKRKASKRPQFQQGDRVRVSGLRSHKSYNGLCGTVLLYVPTERRYQVRLDTNDVIAIKQRNVGVVEKGDDVPNQLPLNSGMKNLKRINNEQGDDAVLSALMLKLMQDNPDTDAGKLGEFAAGYLLSKKKNKKTEGPTSNITERLCM